MNVDLDRAPQHTDGDWPVGPATREDLDAALEEGFASGRSPLTHEQIIAEARRDLELA
jgi:hypothetical protein